MAGKGLAGRTPPRALSSDVWYTLVYLTPRRRDELHARRRRVWTDPLVAAGRSRTDADRWLARLYRRKEEAEARGRTPPLDEQVAWLARRTGVRLDADAVADRLDRALLSAEIRAAPHARRVLTGLAHRGVPLGVVSNVVNESGFAARTVLDRAGLLALFRLVYLSCEHPWSKPRPEPFVWLARGLGVPIGQLLHVGDLAYDVEGACRAGASSLLFTGFSPWNSYLAGAPDRSPRENTRSVASWPALAKLWEARSSG